MKVEEKDAVDEEMKEGIRKKERVKNKNGKKERDLEITVHCFKIRTVEL
jgi:hypothetical protein